MSTNPFRRSSLKGSGGGSPSTGLPYPIEIPQDGSPNVKVPSVQKHVNFASPPTVPISPVSYPSSSPESSRASPLISSGYPAVFQVSTSYSEALQDRQLQQEADADEQDQAIEQARYNANLNNVVISAPDQGSDRGSSVKNTLSKFASGPCRSLTAENDVPVIKERSDKTRQIMDVDAFKRMLLTGNPGVSQGQSPSMTRKNEVVLKAPDNNTQQANTASASQLVRIDSADERTNVSSLFAEPADRKSNPPPVPPSRHGKLVDMKQTLVPAEFELEPANAQRDKLLRSLVSDPPDAIKTPPPPPAARKRGQINVLARNNSSERSLDGTQMVSGVISEPGLKVPPPSPGRRTSATTIEHRPLPDLPPTPEEIDTVERPMSVSRRSSGTKQGLMPAYKSAIDNKRLSTGSLTAPPPPPPRRSRASSRGSIESQGPSVSAAGESKDQGTVDPEDHSIRSGSSAPDLLADLAALQREVDEARQRVNSA